MTWEELKKKADEFEASIINGQIIYTGGLGFTKGGYVFYGDVFGGDQPIAFNRTYAQMYAIMKALQ